MLKCKWNIWASGVWRMITAEREYGGIAIESPDNCWRPTLVSRRDESDRRFAKTVSTIWLIYSTVSGPSFFAFLHAHKLRDITRRHTTVRRRVKRFYEYWLMTHIFAPKPEMREQYGLKESNTLARSVDVPLWYIMIAIVARPLMAVVFTHTTKKDSRFHEEWNLSDFASVHFFLDFFFYIIMYRIIICVRQP